MKFATWNVNSVRQRERHVTEWLGRNQPDLLLLQEIKCEEPQFPREAFEQAGYGAEVLGQKSYTASRSSPRNRSRLPPEGSPAWRPTRNPATSKCAPKA